MVKDHSPATIAITHTRSPAVVLGEEGLGIAQEEDLVALDTVDLYLFSGLSSNSIIALELTFPQAFITQLSLLAMVAMMSTPFSRNLSAFLM